MEFLVNSLMWGVELVFLPEESFACESIKNIPSTFGCRQKSGNPSMSSQCHSFRLSHFSCDEKSEFASR